jgi:DNA-binding NarL/FixJ family response regulator
MVPRILIVDPDPVRQRHLAEAIGTAGIVESVADFQTARARLVATSPDFLIANLRLGEYNGVHLVYHAASAHIPVRAFVYTEKHEPGFAPDIEASGASYQTFRSLRTSVVAHLMADFMTADTFTGAFLHARA